MIMTIIVVFVSVINIVICYVSIYILIISVFLQDNWTALHLAANSGHDNVVTFLFNHGAKVDATTNVS